MEWTYIQAVLDKMNFGPMLKKWFCTFYKNISSCVINNGYTTGFFRLHRGVRQGCPLSGLLFALALEPLAHSIRKNDKIKGLRLGRQRNKAFIIRR